MNGIAFERHLRSHGCRLLRHGGRHDELANIVRPFVYRKYLDYATLDAMRGLHAEVRRDVERRELAGHVKLGPGGIREVEFFVQALQLVHGERLDHPEGTTFHQIAHPRTEGTAFGKLLGWDGS